jgi:hypothetical protein
MNRVTVTYTDHNETQVHTKASRTDIVGDAAIITVKVGSGYRTTVIPLRKIKRVTIEHTELDWRE